MFALPSATYTRPPLAHGCPTLVPPTNFQRCLPSAVFRANSSPWSLAQYTVPSASIGPKAPPTIAWRQRVFPVLVSRAYSSLVVSAYTTPPAAYGSEFRTSPISRRQRVVPVVVSTAYRVPLASPTQTVPMPPAPSRPSMGLSS